MAASEASPYLSAVTTPMYITEDQNWQYEGKFCLIEQKLKNFLVLPVYLLFFVKLCSVRMLGWWMENPIANFTLSTKQSPEEKAGRICVGRSTRSIIIRMTAVKVRAEIKVQHNTGRNSVTLPVHLGKSKSSSLLAKPEKARRCINGTAINEPGEQKEVQKTLRSRQAWPWTLEFESINILDKLMVRLQNQYDGKELPFQNSVDIWNR